MYRVFHGPIEISGQVGLMCQALRRKGITAVGYNSFQTYLQYQSPLIETDAFELQQRFDYAVNFFDIFHFHYSYTFFENHMDLPILNDKGRKIIMHHRGTDVRFSDRARAYGNYSNPYVDTTSSFPDEVIDRNLRYFSRYVSAVLVQDYELYHYVADYYPTVIVLPRLIDLRTVVARYPQANTTVPTIIHAPTDRQFKGSDVIERVIRNLQKRYALKYVVIENMSHNKALECYQEADIVIDQVRCGAYGNLSVEAMAMGKPVVAYIRDDLLDTYPEQLPIVSANPDTLEACLAELIREPQLRNQLGKQGRKYVERYHDSPVVADKLVDVYRQVLGRTSTQKIKG